MDTTKKGRMIFCKICRKKTRHVPEIDKHDKITHWCCEICGGWRIYNHWS